MPETAFPDLEPEAEIVARNPISQPGESPEYRAARNALLAQEIALRRQTEAVAAARRALPPGGPVPEDYAFVGEDGPVRMSDLFGGHDTLVIYSYMFGPKRKNPCPMCTSLMASWAGKVHAIRERVGFALTARSPIDRLVRVRDELGMPDLPVYSDESGAYTRAYVSEEDADMPGYTVFTRRDGTIRHFWSGEMFQSDPGQDPRGGPDPDALWLLLDNTPEGRGTDWYPSLPPLRDMGAA